MDDPSSIISDVIDDHNWDSFDISQFEHIAELILRKFEYDLSNIEVCLYLTNDETIKSLNNEYRGKNSVTNVLSFEGDYDENEKNPQILGSIVIAHDYTLNESKEMNIPFEDHVKHLFIHGMLHLLGYDHIKDEDFEKMKEQEIFFLDLLQIKNPYSELYD